MKPRRLYTAEEIEIADNRIRKTCHPKQARFVFDPGRRVSCVVGRGGGKTAAMLFRLLRRMMARPDANCLFIAATRQSAERLVWRDLKRIVDQLRLATPDCFNESDLVLELPNGSRLMLFGCDDKNDINKLRGITYHEVGIDEVASIKIALLEELLVEVIGPRMVGALCLIGTPGKRLEGLFYEATRPGGSEHRSWDDRDLPEYANWPKWSSHSWNIKDGVDAGILAMVEIHEAQLLEIERQGWSESNPYRRREYDGIWASDASQQVYAYRPYDDAGKEWNQWTPTFTSFGIAIPPPLKDIGYGIAMDVGFKDAFAIEVGAFSYTDPSRQLYQIYEVYRTRLSARDVAKLLIGEDLNHDKYGGIIGQIGWPDVMVGDFAGQGEWFIKELREVYGITVEAADKPYRYKDNAIELMNSDLFEGRIKVMKGSHLATEMTALQWDVDAQGKRIEKKSMANHACFVAGTLIQTASGERPIESISQGELVWTRRGLRPVSAAWCSGEQATFTLTSGGRSLTGTANHPIHTQRGWIDLACLTPSHTLDVWASTDQALLLFSKAKSTGDTQTPPTTPCGATSRLLMASSSIVQCGLHSVVRFLLAITSIMWTAIARTTASITSSRFQVQSISASTCSSQSDSRNRELQFAKPLLPHQFGTRRQKAGHGTASMLERSSPSDQCSIASAPYAGTRSNRSSETRRSAAGSATPRNEGEADSTMSMSHALNAEPSFVATNTRTPNVARCPVESVTPSGCARVYNLTVADEHEYFANGIVVHNCDGWLYLRNKVAPLLASAAAPSLPPQKAARPAQDNVVKPRESDYGDANSMYGDADSLYGAGDW